MNEKKILEVKKDGVYSYSIYLEPDFQGLKEALLPLQTEKKKLCIVTDTNVLALYAEALKDVLLVRNIRHWIPCAVSMSI